MQSSSTDPSLETDATLDAMFDSLLNSTTVPSTPSTVPTTSGLPKPILKRHAAGGPYTSVEDAMKGGSAVTEEVPDPPVLHRTYAPMSSTSTSGTVPTKGFDLDSMQDITGVFDNLDQEEIPDFPEVLQDVLQDRAKMQPELKLCAVSEDVKGLYTTNSTSSKQYATDAGYDLYFTETVTVPPGETVKCDFGVSVEAYDEDDAPCAIDMLPRSSIVKTPLRMANSVGLIDASYRGTLRVYVDNIRTEPYTIQKGDRLFQLVAPSRRPFNASFVEALSETERGDNGFGSTGK